MYIKATKIRKNEMYKKEETNMQKKYLDHMKEVSDLKERLGVN